LGAERKETAPTGAFVTLSKFHARQFAPLSVHACQLAAAPDHAGGRPVTATGRTLVAKVQRAANQRRRHLVLKIYVISQKFHHTFLVKI